MHCGYISCILLRVSATVIHTVRHLLCGRCLGGSGTTSNVPVRSTWKQELHVITDRRLRNIRSCILSSMNPTCVSRYRGLGIVSDVFCLGTRSHEQCSHKDRNESHTLYCCPLISATF